MNEEMAIIERRRILQHILDGHVTILPGAPWLSRHLDKFPDGVIPDQKLEVSIDGGKFRFTVPASVKKGAIEEAMCDF